MANYTSLESITNENVIASLKRNNGFSCTIPYSKRETEMKLSNAMISIFEYLKKPELGNSLVYCLKEIVMNASKANSKRIYFKEKGLDIDNPQSYELGIKTFKQEMFGNFNEYAEKHIERDYFIRIDFKIQPDTLLIRVVNNSKMCPEEEKRINGRLRIASKFNTMEEVLKYGFDQTEGAGFGLIIVVLMLRKVGLDEKAFSFSTGDNTTSVFLKIPLNLLSKEQGMVIAREITAEIETMPQFPESIIRLQKNLADPNADFNSVTKIIKTDSVLTTEIIRIANSPIYMLPKKVDDVHTAVRMIGLKGVKNLLLSFGVNQVFQKKYKKDKINEVMNHSYKVALYCSQIAKRKQMRAISDDIYVAALLHDFGKIITYSLQPELILKLNKICVAKGIPINSLEDLTQGYNHAIVGSMLAQKWNFPEKFIQCVKLHHVPLEAQESNKALVYTVYLGNEIYYYLEAQRNFSDLNYKVLKFFVLEKENDFKLFAESVAKAVQD